jgi:hypothetical protein
MPEFTSSRFAQTSAPPRCPVSRSSRWTGPDLGGGGDGVVDVVGRAGGDQAVVQVDRGMAGRPEALPLQPADRGGEPGGGGRHRRVAAPVEEHGVQGVVRGQGAVEVADLDGSGEPPVRPAHRRDVVPHHPGGRVAGGDLVHRPDDDGRVVHLGEHQRGHAGAALRLALDQPLVREPGQGRPHRRDRETHPRGQVGVLDHLAGSQVTGDDGRPDAVERDIAQEDPADGQESGRHN